MDNKKIKRLLEKYKIKDISQLEEIIKKGIYYMDLEEMCEIMCPIEKEVEENE